MVIDELRYLKVFKTTDNFPLGVDHLFIPPWYSSPARRTGSQASTTSSNALSWTTRQ